VRRRDASSIGAFTVPEAVLGLDHREPRPVLRRPNDVAERRAFSADATRSATKFTLPLSVSKGGPHDGAIVRYHVDELGKVVCTPASGTFFRIGRTTVHGACQRPARRRSFTVVVADDTF
jgi:hypothetical protein